MSNLSPNFAAGVARYREIYDAVKRGLTHLKMEKCRLRKKLEISIKRFQANPYAWYESTKEVKTAQNNAGAIKGPGAKAKRRHLRRQVTKGPKSLFA